MNVPRVTRLLLALFVLRGVVLLCALPPAEMWDEYSHLAHVDHWATTGRPAVYGRTAVDPAFLVASARLPQPSAAGFGRTYAAFWSGLPAPPLPASLGLYEAQHPFLYYALAAPIYRAAGGRSDLPAAVAVLRAVNLACGTAALALILRWLIRNVAGPGALLLGCWVAWQPLLLLNVVRVANDALAYLLGTAVVVIALDLRRPRWWPRVAALAVLLPLAILAKVTNATLLPAVAVAMVIAAMRGSARPWTVVAAAALVAIVTAAVLGPYVAVNLHLFGLATPMQEAVANRAAGRSLWTVLTATPPTRWPVWAASWWVANALWVGGWSFLSPPRVLVVAYAALLATAAVATVARWRRLPLSSPSRWTAVAVVLCAHVGLMVHGAESYAAWGGRPSTNPWYAAVAVPWWLVLLGCGGLSLPWPAVRRLLMLGVPAVCLSTEAFGLFHQMLPTYYAAPPLSLTGLRRMATLHPAVLGPPTFLAAIAATAVLVVWIGRQVYRALPVAGGESRAICSTPSGPTFNNPAAATRDTSVTHR